MAKRFYFTFKTILNRTVTVDIYDRDYSGSAIELNKDVANSPGCPTDDPVTIEEDDSTNMLDVFRTKTGYLNFIELTEGGLASLYAKDNSQLEVQIKVDNLLIFKGYIQAQTFDSDWKKYRTKVRIPIQSFMETMDNEPISDIDYSGSTSLGEVVENDFQRYAHIVIPDLYVTDNNHNQIHPLALQIMNRTLSPYNDDYDFGKPVDGVLPDVYTPMKMREFIEQMCYHYGLVAHDVKDKIILTRVDFWGDYLQVVASDAGHPDDTSTVVGNSTNVIQFYDYFSIGSDKNKEKLENSLASVKIEVGEEQKEVEIDLSMSKYAGSYVDGNNVVLSLQTREIISSYMTTQGGALTGTKVRVIGDGDNEYLQVRAAVYDTQLFKCVFETQFPNLINGLTVEADIPQYSSPIEMYICVYSGGKYYNFGEEGELWIDTPSYTDLTFNDGKAHIFVNSNGSTVEVRFFARQNINTWQVLFKSFKLDSSVGNALAKYTTPSPTYIFRKGDSASLETGETDNKFYWASLGNFSIPRYRYMFQSQKVLKIIARNTAIIDDTSLYMSKMQIGSDTTLWRVVAISRDLINDEYTLTLMHSDLTETLTPPNS
jgi:hypothetical protein